MSSVDGVIIATVALFAIALLAAIVFYVLGLCMVLRGNGLGWTNILGITLVLFCLLNVLTTSIQLAQEYLPYSYDDDELVRATTYGSMVASFLTYVFEILLFCAIVCSSAKFGSKSGHGGKGLRIYAFVFTGILLVLALANFGLGVSLAVKIEQNRNVRNRLSSAAAISITRMSIARVRLNFSLLVLTLAAAVSAAGTGIGLLAKRIAHKSIAVLLFVSSVLLVTAAATNLGISVSQVDPVRGYRLRYSATPIEVLIFLSMIFGTWTLVAGYATYVMACRAASRFSRGHVSDGVGTIHKTSQYA
ncbi:hypothetical protein VHEMI00047 [[Torrubiella] hemipterigena]|uniref:Uncharacterized protein n=1 Tax=[Torrubiella] hemipterigena TaxID=1531966 RepID=A0A0A1T135_9HYPO|nr:hypothetical protein VHEMI00047 [[Torrubiella] hemipterigena]